MGSNANPRAKMPDEHPQLYRRISGTESFLDPGRRGMFLAATPLSSARRLLLAMPCGALYFPNSNNEKNKVNISLHRPNCRSVFRDVHNARRHLDTSHGHGMCFVGRDQMPWALEVLPDWKRPMCPESGST
eukprot:9382492-Pyramimonas_sp.AAC.1